ncbi:MAG: IS630 family transposase [Burkholderiales bacterium]
MARAAALIELSPEQEAELRRLVRTPSTANQAALRARIVLRAAEGATNTEIGRELGLSLPTVGLWRRQFARAGVAGLADRPRSGRPPMIDETLVQRVLAKTLEPPPHGESHWSVRRLARELGLAPTTVHRIWREHRLKPHRTRTFKYSTDPELVAKVVDIVGLYLNPPEGALVVCVDEKTQVQALDRTQPILPLAPGLPERRTHDYKRNGTTNLYAALEIASGQVVHTCQPRHRHQEFLAFLRRIVREFPDGELHLVLDNSSTHTTPEVRSWLARHKRVHFHFTPTSASWMNLIESWFSILTRQQVRRGSYSSERELIDAIGRFVAGWNERACPFVWTKSAGHVLAGAVKDKRTSGTEH